MNFPLIRRKSGEGSPFLISLLSILEPILQDKKQIKGTMEIKYLCGFPRSANPLILPWIKETVCSEHCLSPNHFTASFADNK